MRMNLLGEGFASLVLVFGHQTERMADSGPDLDWIWFLSGPDLDWIWIASDPYLVLTCRYAAAR